MSLTSILGRFAKGFKGPAETVISTGLGFGSQIVFTPPLQEAANEMWDQFPNLPLSPDVMARLYRRSEVSLDTARRESRLTGYDAERFDWLSRALDNVLDAGQVMLLLARKEISEDEALHHLAAAGYTQDDATALLRARFTQPALGELLELINRGELSEDEAKTQLERSGLPPELTDKLLALRVREPDVSTLLTAVNRGELSEAQATASLRKMGFAADKVKAILALRQAFPSPNDLIRMAVREVFTPRIRELYGLDEDFPAEFLDLAQKAGMSEDFAHWSWAAHWELPSLTNGFEMYQRAIITEDQLKDLMRSQDVMPFWRDKLIKLAFQPLTRVDIRRMYAAGVLTPDQVYRANLDNGYSPEHAKALTDWITSEKTSDTKDFTKSETLALFESRAIDGPTTLSSLEQIGYSEQEAQLLINLSEYRRKKAVKDKAVGVVRSRYIAKKIEKPTADNLLDQLQVAPDEKEDLLKIWDLEREAQTADLTVAQMQALWKREEIDDTQFDTDMVRRGYSQQEAEWLRILATKPPAPADTGG